jgi:hypothetical protein
VQTTSRSDRECLDDTEVSSVRAKHKLGSVHRFNLGLDDLKWSIRSSRYARSSLLDHENN